MGFRRVLFRSIAEHKFNWACNKNREGGHGSQIAVPLCIFRRAVGLSTRSYGIRTGDGRTGCADYCAGAATRDRSEEHTSEIQSLMRTSYAVFCLKKKKTKQK